MNLRDRKERLFSVREAAEYAGMTPSMVNYLHRTSVIKPANQRRSRRGVRRFYAFPDLVLLRAINTLLERGVQVARLKQALLAVQRQLRSESLDSSVVEFLVTDGKYVYLRTSTQVLENLSSGSQYELALVVPIKSISQDLAGRIYT